ncbi:MAG: ParB N-terminal domain-containing protein [Deltaproteobacteria bacterium]|nr:ParB N-terminal domain-containing protein [Deltaproteobacteria bacterium]
MDARRDAAEDGRETIGISWSSPTRPARRDRRQRPCAVDPVMEIEIVHLDRRHAGLRIADPARLAHLVGSLARHGQQSPVLLVKVEDRTVLVDGYLRVTALTDLGRDLVDAVVLDHVDEVGALLLRHRLQARRSTALEDGWLLIELLEVHHRTQADLATVLQKSTSWVSRRLALARALPALVQEAVRVGSMPPHAAMKFLVPLARANAADCEAVVVALGHQRVTTREIERLYLAWRRGDPEQRARIISNPRLFLKVEAELEVPPVAPDETSALVDDLEGVAGLCRRARKRLRTGVLERASASERAPVAAAWRETREALRTLAARMDAEEFDGRPRDTHRDPAAGQRRPQPSPDREDVEGVTEHRQEDPRGANTRGPTLRSGIEAPAPSDADP